MQESLVELKYCERCGGLWLRLAGSARIYCAICSKAMAELPPPLTEVRRRRSVTERNAEEELECYAEYEFDLDMPGGAI